MPDLHPALPFALAMLLLPFAGAGGRRLLSVLGPAAAALFVTLLPEGTRPPLAVAGLELTPLRIDALARVFAWAFAGFGCVAGIYAWREERASVRAAGLALGGSGVGVALAGDLLTLIFFWEGLAVSSLFLIWGGGTRAALGAGMRYLLFHLAGGACLLAGAVAVLAERGPAFGPLGLEGWGGWLILIGFAVNAGIPPLHAWLPDAYPRAGVAGTVFLSAYTTKAGVYALARGFAGEEVLVWAGVAMALYGVVFAVLENDIRRLLGYHIVSQVGYMVCGVGVGTALALDGVAAHAFCHIFYKGLLLMAAGAVLHSTGMVKLTDLGGLARALPLTLLFYTVGAFSISGVPLFNGFVSKSMVVSGAAEAGRSWVELLLVIASMGTFLHTGLKLPYFTFFASAGKAAPRVPVPASMKGAMALAAALCIGVGVAPGLLYAALPHGGAYQPYTAAHVVEALQLLVGTALGFWLLRAKLGGEATVTRDADFLYRAPLRALASGLGAFFEATLAGAWFPAARLALLARRVRTTAPAPTVAAQVAFLVLAIIFVAALALSNGPWPR